MIQKKTTLKGKLYMAKVLVIVANSFIGSHLVAKLVEFGAVVHATYRSDKPIFSEKVAVEYLDVTDSFAIKNRLRQFQPDYVYNLAAHVTGSRNIESVAPTFATNLGGTLNLLSAVAEYPVKRLVMIGSMEEYQENTNMISPTSPYAASKIASSAYANMYYNLYQVPVVIARVFMVYGPQQKDEKKLIPYTITSILNGETPKFSSGTREVDWIYVSDVVNGLIRMILAPNIEGESIYIGSGCLHSVRDVISKIFEILEMQQAPLFGVITDRAMETVVTTKVERTKQLIHWEPLVDFETGLKSTIDWYKQVH